MNLNGYLKNLGRLSDEELKFVSAYFIRTEIPKGEFYLKEGQISDKVSFVEKGLFKLFYRLNGEEKIMLFFSENQFMTDYFGFLTNTPSIRPIQALEDSVIYSINKKNLNNLYDSSKNWERIGRQLAESAYVASILRANRLLHDNFDTRFSTFIAENPVLIQRIPQYMIASYLNMTPETLSRVKKRAMKNRENKTSIHKINSSDFLI